MTALYVGATPQELVPGRPEDVERLAARLAVLADGLGRAGARLRSIQAGDWRGEAGDAFRSIVGQQPDSYEKAAASFTRAVGAARSYATVLREAQAEAHRAIGLYEDGHASSTAWENRVSDYQAAERRAEADPTAEARLATLTRPAAYDPGADDMARAGRILSSAREQVETEAARAARTLQAAWADAPDEPGLFEKALHWGGEFLAGFAEATWGTVEFLWSVSSVRMMIDPQGWLTDITALGQGLLYGIQHPVEFGKAILDWDTWAESSARALGHLGPDLLLALATAGAGGAASRTVRGLDAASDMADLATDVRRGADALDDVSDGARLADNIDPLAVAADRTVDVSRITPNPVWRTDNAPLYRADNRDYDEIFDNGFHPRDPSKTDLDHFVRTNEPSAFVSTTRDPGLIHEWRTDYFYEVDVPGGIDVSKTLPKDHYPNEAEVSFPGGIRPEYIKGARPYDSTTGRLGDFIPNPNYVPRPK